MLKFFTFHELKKTGSLDDLTHLKKTTKINFNCELHNRHGKSFFFFLKVFLMIYLIFSRTKIFLLFKNTSLEYRGV